MKAAEFRGPGQVTVSEFEVDAPPPGWVRVGVTASGICGSDLHLLRGNLFPNVGMRPGHEIAGIVDAVGDGVTLETGTHVAVEPILACGHCSHCDTGFFNRCPDNRLFGVTAPGGLAEFVNVPAAALHALPADLDRNAAALSEPMAVCFRAIRLGEIGVGSRVAVLGSGTIGLLSILLARDSGAEVYATARYPQQAELATALGAAATFGSHEELLAALGDDLIDVTVETVGGSADTLTEAVTITRPGGRIVVLGVFEGNPPLPGLGFMAKELTMVGSNCYARDGRVGDFGLATEQIVRHADAIAALVTHRFSLDQVVEAFAAAGDKKAGAVKVQLMPGA